MTGLNLQDFFSLGIFLGGFACGYPAGLGGLAGAAEGKCAFGDISVMLLPAAM